MSAAAALRAARKAGVQVAVCGNDLSLEASVPPPSAVLDLLARHKSAIVALLRLGQDGWSAEDWQAFFHERAGIPEYDGGLPRTEAEARAYACCVAEWLIRNPVHSSPGSCLRCGGQSRTDDPLLPHGTDTTAHAWLHSRCWPAWFSSRRNEAMAALTCMGVLAPAELPDDFGKNGDA